MGFILKKGVKDWPSGIMRYYISDDFNAEAKKSIKAACRLWTEKTNWRFFYRANGRAEPRKGFVRFKKRAGHSNSKLGNTGNGQTIYLSNDEVSFATIIHEVGHAMGIHHEHSRPDRDDFLKIYENRIEDNGNVNVNNARNSEKVGNYDYKSIMHYEPNSFLIPFEKNWGAGWTTARYYEIGGKGFCFLLREKSGDMHSHKVIKKGRIRGRVEMLNWSNGWTQAEFFTIRGKTFLFILKRGKGYVHIYRMNNNGQIGREVERHDWSSGWTTVRFYTVGNKTYLFLLKSGNGHVYIHEMNNDGSVGGEVEHHDWSNGWTNAEFYKVGGKTYLFLLKTRNGDVSVHRMNDNGSVGREIERKDWSSGWTSTEFFEIDGKPYLMLVKEGDGRVQIQHVNRNGKIGRKLIRYDWDSGWSSAEIYPYGNRKYLLLLNKSSGEMQLRGMHYREEHVGKISGIASWVDGPTMEIRDDIGIPKNEREELQHKLGRAKELSSGDIAAANKRLK